VLLASEEWAEERNLPVLAYLVDAETAAVDYVHGDEGLLMAPAYAVPRMLDRNGLTLQDFDLYEIHEAFAVHRPRHPEGLGGRRVLPRAARAATSRSGDRPRPG
jgi:acetyl-CoA acetyltransferase